MILHVDFYFYLDVSDSVSEFLETAVEAAKKAGEVNCKF
jgi:hypothetical protein